MERLVEGLPGKNDRKSVITALIRLQEVYLDQADFANITGSATHPDNVLTGEMSRGV